MTGELSAEDLDACQVLWNFNSIRRAVDNPDAILVMGSNDLCVATYAAEVANGNRRAVVVCSGGVAHRGDLLDTGWDEAESDVLAREMIRGGVDPARILVERSATNTADNVILARALLEKAQIVVKRLVVVQKPFMSLRALLTTQHNWPGIAVGVSHEQIAFAAYLKRYGRTSLVDIIAGDTQRLITYAQRGFFASIEIPHAVQEALNRLIERGYVAHMPA
jgi:uncharacterized SAM-binding protein YcdF (DUF218 family)